MKRNLYLAAIFAASTFAFTSCKDNDSTTPGSNSSFLRKITDGEVVNDTVKTSNVQEFSYAGNRLDKVHVTTFNEDGSASVSDYKIVYLDNGKVDKAEQYVNEQLVGYEQFEYNDSMQISQVTFYTDTTVGGKPASTQYHYNASKGRMDNVQQRTDSANVLVQYMTFAYNSDGNVQTAVNYDASNTAVGKTEYQYDERGNYTVAVGFSRNLLGTLVRSSQDTYTYDDKKSPYSLLKALGVSVVESPSNPIQKVHQTVSTVTGQVTATTTTNYTLEYNGANYATMISSGDSLNRIYTKFNY